MNEFQKKVLLLAKKNGSYTPQNRTYSGMNKAAEKALAAGLMRKEGEVYVLTKGGADKVKGINV